MSHGTSQPAVDDRLAIRFTYLSQDALLEAGCFDLNLAIDTAEQAILANSRGEVLQPDKIVQIFD